MKFVVSGAFLSPERLIEVANVADECGYEAISLPDHVVYPETLDTPYPYTDDGMRRYDERSDFPDPWITVAALAAVTKRIRFTNNAFVVPLRNPFLLAKQIATAARYAPGRITLTMGVGWSKVEFELAGQSFEGRGARADEMIELMRRLWRGEQVEGEGRFYRYPRLRMTPPFPATEIPIWSGGISEVALKARPPLRRLAHRPPDDGRHPGLDRKDRNLPQRPRTQWTLRSHVDGERRLRS